MWLLIVSHLHSVGGVSHRLFNTMTVSKDNSNIFDCLIGLPLASISNIYKQQATVHNYHREVPQFCRRSTLSNSEQILMLENFTETHRSKFTFESLRSMGITYQELHQWYAPIDLIEEYIAGSHTGEFVNCSGTRWFGLNCEYAFDSNEYLNEIMVGQYSQKVFVPDDLSVFNNGTCYEMHNSDCESIICLDWREICDGKDLG